MPFVNTGVFIPEQTRTRLDVLWNSAQPHLVRRGGETIEQLTAAEDAHKTFKAEFRKVLADLGVVAPSEAIGFGSDPDTGEIFFHTEK